MKIKTLVLALIGMSLGLKAQENILIGLNSPAYGVKIKANWVGYNGDWARGFSIANENNTQNFLEFGAIGSATEGSSSFSYGYIGKKFDDTFMIFRADGKIGIGTTSPSKLLDVNGDAKIGNLNSRQYLKISSLQWPEVRFETPTSNEQIRIGVAHADNNGYGVENGDLYVYTQTTNKMPFVIRRNGNLRLNLKGGNVGIGTNSTGSHKLAVEGSIGAREIKVEANGWSDFVFYENYKLPTLQEVENHIKENGHLKDIPSAKEVEENGIFLGEMNSKLLQKIEELTLYTIQQQKEIESLKRENKEVKSLNEKLLELQSRLEKLESEK